MESSDWQELEDRVMSCDEELMNKFAVVLLSALTLAACAPGAPGQSPEPPVTPSTVSPNPEPSPSLSPLPSESPSSEPSPTVESPNPSQTVSLSPEQEPAVVAAMEYFRTMDATRSDVNASLQPLADITDGDMRTMSMQVIQILRAQGLQQRGPARYQVTDVGSIYREAGEDRIIIRTCSDATDIETIDVATGEPAVGVQKVQFAIYELTLADRNGWKPFKVRSGKAQSCP